MWEPMVAEDLCRIDSDIAYNYAYLGMCQVYD